MNMMSKKATAEIAKIIASKLNDVMGENSTMPEVREEWLNSTKKIAERYVRGEITKKEMKSEYDKRKSKLVQFLYLSIIMAA